MQIKELLLGAYESEAAFEAVQRMLWLFHLWQPSSLQILLSATLLVEQCPGEVSPWMEISICIPGRL